VSEPLDAPGAGAPRWLIALTLAVATILAVGAVLNTWVNRQVLDSDEWVEVSDRLLDDDDIRGALATYLVAELFRTVDVQGGLEELLPDGVGALAGPLAATLEANAVPVADSLLASDAVATAWTGLNSRTHELFVAVVRDEVRDGLTTADGSLTVELDVLLALVAERLGLPGDLVEGIDDDAAELVIFSSDELDVLQGAVAVIELLSVVLFVLVVGLYALAVWMSRDRRRAMRHVGWAVAGASVVLLLVRRLSVSVATEQLAEAESGREAVASIMTITTSLLNELAWAGLAIGVVIVGYTVLLGPTDAAAGVRRFSAPVLTSTVAIWSTAVAGVVLLLTVVPGFSVRNWIPALVFVALIVAAVESTRRFCVAEASTAGSSSADTSTDVPAADPPADQESDERSPAAAGSTSE